MQKLCVLLFMILMAWAIFVRLHVYVIYLFLKKIGLNLCPSWWSDM